MNERSAFWICGRKLALPGTPEPIEILLEKRVKKAPKKGKKRKTKDPVTPKKKRYRLKKKQK